MTPFELLAEALQWVVPDPRGPRGWMLCAALFGITGLALALFLAWRYLHSDSADLLDGFAIPMLLGALTVISAVFAAFKSPASQPSAFLWVAVGLLVLASPWLAIHLRTWVAA